MIVVIFEAIPRADGKSEYFDIANELKPTLNAIEGFISIERFQSLNDPKRLLSLSFWKDETAIKQWREMPSHVLAQKKGQATLFEEYRLRVAHVLRDYSKHDRAQAPSPVKGV